MNRNRLHQLRYMAAAFFACVGIVSCSQEEPADSQGELFPPGKYPLELTVGGLQVVEAQGKVSAPDTRATVDDNFYDMGPVAVREGDENSEVKKYIPTPKDYGNTADLICSDDPFYWRSANETKHITMWHPYSDNYPTDWTVKADQSKVENYQANDLVIAESDWKFDHKDWDYIAFEHQTAKVEIRLKAADGFVLDENTSVKLLNIEGVEGGGTTITTYYKTDNRPKAYFALLNEQTIKAGEKFIQITTNGTDFYYKPKEDRKLGKCQRRVYEIMVNAKGLDVSVSESMSWGTDGATGSGSVTLPTEINLSDKPIEIKDNGNYIITGKGTQTVTINGNAHVTFSNVNITTTEGAPIHVTGGSPTLHFNGENTLNCEAKFWGGIAVESSQNLTLTGDTENAKLTIINSNSGNNANTVGIGTPVKDGQNPGSTCGNITISNLYLTINSSMGSGIGATHHSVCGDIEITDCKLDITTVNNAACIGASCGSYDAKSQCGSITLRNCEIESLDAVYAFGYNDHLNPAAIGCSTGNAHCGDINIYLHETYAGINDFLTRLIVYRNVDKVGTGNEWLGKTPTTGTITWYDHNEVKIGEGTRK